MHGVARSADDVVLHWFGCATFRLAVGETVVFLDAYLDRVSTAPDTGLRPEDVERADWIVVGHSHFDHLWGAERIAKRTGATTVGSYETVRIMAAEGVPDEQLVPVSGGERVRLADDLLATALPSLHSCVWTHAQMPQPHEVCLGDFGLTWQEQRQRYAQLTSHIATLSDEIHDHLARANQGARGDGGALVFLFETPFGSLLYQDTSGHWTGILRGLQPDVAILAAAGRGNVDGDPVQGTLAGFLASEARLMQPRRVLLSHHDDWLPGFSIGTDTSSIARELAALPMPPELVELAYDDGFRVLAGL